MSATDEPPVAEDEQFDPAIVTIGELQLRRIRAHEREHQEACPHKKVTVNPHGEVVRCKDCGAQVSAYWMLEQIVAQWATAQGRYRASVERLEWEKKKHVHLIAARRIEQAWRGKMAPACPHCHTPILPEDGLGAGLQVSFAYERARRKEQADA